MAFVCWGRSYIEWLKVVIDLSAFSVLRSYLSIWSEKSQSRSGFEIKENFVEVLQQLINIKHSTSHSQQITLTKFHPRQKLN